MSLAATGSDVGPSTPDGGHKAQFLGNFIQGCVLGQALKSIEHCLLVGHDGILLCAKAKSNTPF